MVDYIALDLETANAKWGSICQIGFVIVKKNKIEDQYETLIDPEDDFDGRNMGIHKITPSKVKGSPRFPAIMKKIAPYLANQIIVTHGHFDGWAVKKAAIRYGLNVPPVTWVDNIAVARQTWPGLPGGHSLPQLSEHFGIALQHHDALSDATAAAEIFKLALKETKRSVRDCLECAYYPR